MGRVFANGLGELGSIPGRVISKTLKMVLDTSLLNTQQYKIRIKGKVEKFSSYYTSGAFQSPSTNAANFALRMDHVRKGGLCFLPISDTNWLTPLWPRGGSVLVLQSWVAESEHSRRKTSVNSIQSAFEWSLEADHLKQKRESRVSNGNLK